MNPFWHWLWVENSHVMYMIKIPYVNVSKKHYYYVTQVLSCQAGHQYHTDGPAKS